MRRKLISVTIGAALTLGLLEIGLALAYGGFAHLQARRNRALIEGGEREIRIACIGESTTAVAGDESGRMLVPRTSYPTQLQRILDASQSSIDFRVLNLGMMAGKTGSALDLLESTLPDYRPHVVIAMMGIKDTAKDGTPATAELPSWLASLRTVQLVSWLREGVLLRYNENAGDVASLEELSASANKSITQQLKTWVRETRLIDAPELAEAVLPGMRLALYYWDTGRLERARALLQQMIAEHDVGYNVLARVLATCGESPEAEQILEAAILLHPDEGMYSVVLAELLAENGRLLEAEAIIEEALGEARSFRESELVKNYLLLALADVNRELGDCGGALTLLRKVDSSVWATRYNEIFPSLKMLKHAALGRVFIATNSWNRAEFHLTRAIQATPRKHVNMWLLSTVYRQTGELDKEERVRRELLKTTGRLAEYFELAKLFRLAGDADRVGELLEHAVGQIPSLAESYRRLYELTRREGIQLIVMQYPSFSLELLHRYAPPADDVLFIDNKQLFAASPDDYFFEPRFPYSFSHYTEQGAGVLARHVANTISELYEINPPR